MDSINSIKEIQEKMDNFIKNHGGYWSPLSMLAAIMEEVGELAREINYLEGYKPKKEKKREKNKIGEEITDLFYSVICLANYYSIDLNKELNQTLEKYYKRDSNRFI